jgi:hypothetical protein
VHLDLLHRGGDEQQDDHDQAQLEGAEAALLLFVLVGHDSWWCGFDARSG